MKYKLALTLALAVGASTAFASDFYVVGSVGRSYEKIDGSIGDTDLALFGMTNIRSSVDEVDTGYKLQLGWRFHKNFAVEGGWVDLGKTNYAANFTTPFATPASALAEWKASGFNIGVVGSLPLSDSFSIFGRLGWIDAKVEASFAATGFPTAVTKVTKLKTNYGVGAAYEVNQHFGVRIEWERFNNLGNDQTVTGTGIHDFDLLSIGVVAKF